MLNFNYAIGSFRIQSARMNLDCSHSIGLFCPIVEKQNGSNPYGSYVPDSFLPNLYPNLKKAVTMTAFC